NASKFVFTTSPQTLSAGLNSGTVTVQLQRSEERRVGKSGAGQTVNLGTSSSGGIVRNTADTLTVTSVTIPSGSSTASFLYKDTVAGSPTIAADDQAPQTGTYAVLTRLTFSHILFASNASKFVFTTSPQTLSAGLNSGTVTVQLQ